VRPAEPVTAARYRFVVAGPKHYRAGVVIRDGARLGAEAARRLAQAGRGEIGPGLTDAEFDRIETTYGFEVDYIHQEFGGPGPARTDPRWKPAGDRRVLEGIRLT